MALPDPGREVVNDMLHPGEVGFRVGALLRTSRFPPRIAAMITLRDIRYVRLGTRNLDAASEYAKRILGLQEVRREHKSIYFRSDSRDHTLVYCEGDPAHV